MHHRVGGHYDGRQSPADEQKLLHLNPLAEWRHNHLPENDALVEHPAVVCETGCLPQQHQGATPDWTAN